MTTTHKPRLTSEQAITGYNRACDMFRDGKITTDELLNAANNLAYSQRCDKDHANCLDPRNDAHAIDSQ